jgi:hypothetical protein
MTPARVKAILEILSSGREDKIARQVLMIFGASTFEECQVTYESVGAAERATLADALMRVTANASAAFWLSVDNRAQ